MKNKLHGFVAVIIAYSTILIAPIVSAAEYPERAVQLIVPFSVGGGTDAVARAFAKAAQKQIPDGMVVINKPGAGGAIGWKYMMNAKPDGYTLGVVTVEMAILPHLNLFNHTYKDIVPIAQLNADPAAIIVRADSPYKTIEQLIANAKSRSGALSMGTSGNGTIYDLAAAAFEDKSKAKFNRIPFQGAGPAIVALLGNQLDAIAASPGEVAQYLKSGDLRMLAVMADQRVAKFDTVPTLKEKGIDLSIGTWRGIMGPKGLSEEVVDRLKILVAKTAKDPDFRELLNAMNLGFVYADKRKFKAIMERDNEFFKNLVTNLPYNP